MLGAPAAAPPRKIKRGLRRSEIAQLIGDLAMIGYCIKDICQLTRQCPNNVKRALEDADLEVGKKPGRMITEIHPWFQSSEAWLWASVYLQHLKHVIERLDDPHMLQGVSIRDATRLTDWRFGMWDEEPISRRARMVLMLTDSYLAGEVELKKCGECGFRFMRYDPAVAVRNKRIVIPKDCPCCSTMEKGAEALKQGGQVEKKVVRPTMGGLFDD